MEFGRRGVLLGAASAFGLTMIPVRAAGAASDGLDYGMVEISTGGITMSVYRLDADVFRRSAGMSGYERLAPKRISAVQPLLPNPLHPDNVDKDAAIDAADLVTRNIGQLKSLYGLDDAHICVVASSGVASYSGRRIAEFRARLKARTGHDVDILTPAAEARMTFDWIVPAARRPRTLQFDLGSGNTKGGYYGLVDHAERYRGISVPFGTKTLARAVKARWPNVRTGDFAARAAQYYDEVIAPSIGAQLAAAPEAMARPDICITGGIVWATAMIVRPREMAERRDWLAMAGADFTALRRLIEAGMFYGAGLLDNMAAGQETWVVKNVGLIRNVFNPHQLAAGAALGEGLARQLDFARRAEVSFATFANNSWSSQYLVETFGGGRVVAS